MRRKLEFIGLDNYAGPDDGSRTAHLARLLKPEFQRVCNWLAERHEPGERRDRKGYFPSDRQAQVLSYRVQGYSIMEIARQLDLADQTVRAYLETALRKLKALSGIGMFTVIVEELGSEAGEELVGGSNWHWFEEQVREAVAARQYRRKAEED